MRRVLLLGATGLVGSELLSFLLADSSVDRVRVLSRRLTGLRDSRLEEHVIDDLTEMDKPHYAGAFAVDQIFCALGTTIKKAGSQEQFRKVDHDIPVMAARLGLAAGAHHYLLVSSLGADSESRIFYNRVKGEVERDVIATGYRSVTIARPSLLLGPRQEHRAGEEFAKHFGWIMPAKYRPIGARTVARGLVETAREDAAGGHILESRELRDRFGST